MKIIYLLHQFYPEYHAGTEKFVYNLASMTQKAGHKVKVVTYSFYNASFYDRQIGNIMVKEFSHDGIPVLALRHVREPADLHHNFDDPDIERAADDIFAAEAPDLVHLCHPMRVGAAVKALIRLGIPYVATLTDFFLLCPKVNLSATRSLLCAGPRSLEVCQDLCPELDYSYLRRRMDLSREIIAKARKVFAPSRFIAAIYQQELEGVKVQVVSHGLSLQGVIENSTRYDRASKLSFCYAGSLNPFKGPDLVIEAFRLMGDADVTLKIFGGGNDAVYIDSLKKMAVGDERIEFQGQYSPEEIWKIFCNIDVLIIPSKCYESYSIVLHEAIACNLPVVASNLGALAEKVTDGVNGFLFEAGNAHALKKTLEKILNDPACLNSVKDNLQSVFVPMVEQEACIYERHYREIYLQKSSLM